MDGKTTTQQEAAELLKLIEERKKYYRIADFELQDHQQTLLDATSELVTIEDKILPKYVWLLFQWGNGAWKTITTLYIAILFALWQQWKNYNLPYIGSKRNIFIGTESGENLKNSIMPYLLWDYSQIRIPPELIKKVTQDNGIVKRITLTNGCIINFFTYDQWRKRIQWTNWDLYLLDEEPVDRGIFDEALARTRNKGVQMLLSFTPLSWYTASYEYFYEQTSENVKAKSYVQVSNSKENKHADHTWAEGLTENDRKMRMEWLFVPPTWLVYPNFNREQHTVPYFNPKELWNVKYYAGLDFWQAHPTAFVPIAVDEDWNIYIFDLIYKSNILTKDLANGIKEIERQHNMEFEHIIADSAGLGQRNELKALWIKTTPSDKTTVGMNNKSNRETGIMKVNQLLFDNKIFIADHLKDAIKEFETHHYDKNGNVDKTNDDFLDALRYFIFNYKAPEYISKREIEYERKYKHSYKNKRIHNNNNNPY